MNGFVDLHCHLLYGLDDGAKTVEDSLAMGRLLAELGFSTVAPSPHARPEYASATIAQARLEEVRSLFQGEKIPLKLEPNAENFLDGTFLQGLGKPTARLIGEGPYVLVELPYAAPVPSLLDLVFRIRLKGVIPLFAHPERCSEFARPGRAKAVVNAGAFLQLDVGALIGRYGPSAQKWARQFLEEDLYAVAATDLHHPKRAREWLERAVEALRSQAGEKALELLLKSRPARILYGDTLESGVA